MARIGFSNMRCGFDTEPSLTENESPPRHVAMRVAFPDFSLSTRPM
jgi:hypothetical protein